MAHITLKVEVWASGHQFALASGTVTAGERRQVQLRGGGVLDVQVTVSKVAKPALVKKLRVSKFRV